MNEKKPAKAMHRRSVDYQSWLHEDGSLEMEAGLTDSKAYDTRIGINRQLPAGEPVHDMTIRLLLGADLRIREIDLQMASSPFAICQEVVGNFQSLRGASMGKGWNALLSERFAGIGGCRHLVDLLRGMGTVAFQSLPHGGWSESSLAKMTDSCHAFHREGPVVARLASGLHEKDPE